MTEVQILFTLIYKLAQSTSIFFLYLKSTIRPTILENLVFGISNQIIHKAGCTTTEDDKRLSASLFSQIRKFDFQFTRLI